MRHIYLFVKKFVLCRLGFPVVSVRSKDGKLKKAQIASPEIIEFFQRLNAK